MGQQVFYIITDAQAAILDAFGISYGQRSGKKYVTDFDSVYASLQAAMEEDGEFTEDEFGQLEAFADAGYHEVYWSTDAGDVG